MHGTKQSFKLKYAGLCFTSWNMIQKNHNILFRNTESTTNKLVYKWTQVRRAFLKSWIGETIFFLKFWQLNKQNKSEG